MVNDLNKLDFFTDNASSSRLTTTQVFRDFSAWYHIVLAVDTTQATASNRVKVYVNGSQITAFDTANYPSQNLDTQVNNTQLHTIGRVYDPFYANMYLALVHFIDGQALTPSSFGETSATTGRWEAKTYAGTYGTNGFFLDFLDNSSNTASTLGKDGSGNSNNWTPVNISTTTTSVTYARNAQPASSTPFASTTLTDTTWESTVANDGGFMSNTVIPKTTTKTYIEIRHTSSGGGNPGPGISNSTTLDIGLATAYAWYRGADGLERGGIGAFTGSNTAWTTTDYLGIGMDPTANSGAGSVTFYKNGVAVWTGGSGWTSYDMRFQWQNNGNGTDAGTVNYGASPFQYLPSGYVGLIASSTPNTTDSLRDHPTSAGTSTGLGGEVSGNYCVINPLGVSANTPTISDGNLQMTLGSQQAARLGTIGVTSGKWYWEIVYTAATAFDGMVGVARQAHNLSNYVGSSSDSWGYYYNGVKYNAGSATSYGSSWTTGDVIGVALDMDNLALYFSKNGTWQNSGVPTSGASKTGAAYTNLSGEIFPALNAYGGTQVANFGQRAWSYTAPSGFSPLVDTLLPTPTIAKPNTVMDVKLYTGNGSTQTISGLGFSPDLVWIKSRSNAYFHGLWDQVRGTGKYLGSNTTMAEGGDSTDLLSAFNSDGFSVNATYLGAGNGTTNATSNTYVAWAWDAGSSNATNTSGTITSTVRANISAGFSIQTWTASGSGTPSWGHGLNIAPEFVVVKRRNSAQDWYVWHKALTSSQYLFLNSTAAVASFTNIWGSSGPSSSVISFAASAGDHVSYAWAPVAGYSAFGSYAGTSVADGPHINVGFRPRLVLIKPYDWAVSWMMFDSSREPYNQMSTVLWPNLSSAELNDTDYRIDFLSNGFKLRDAGGGAVNRSPYNYIYCAWAEAPFPYARAR